MSAPNNTLTSAQFSSGTLGALALIRASGAPFTVEVRMKDSVYTDYLSSNSDGAGHVQLVIRYGDRVLAIGVGAREGDPVSSQFRGTSGSEYDREVEPDSRVINSRTLSGTDANDFLARVEDFARAPWGNYSVGRNRDSYIFAH